MNVSTATANYILFLNSGELCILFGQKVFFFNKIHEDDIKLAQQDTKIFIHSLHNFMRHKQIYSLRMLVSHSVYR